MRSLSPEEAELWARVTATIKPLSREPADKPQDAATAASPGSVSTAAARPKGSRPKAPAAPLRPAPRPGVTLDGSWDKKLRSGAVRPDRIVDIHGHSLARAWQAIEQALDQASERGERVVLLITGHERKGEPPIERGRIRAAVHDWLAASRHAGKIAAVRGAHPRHGGGGSLYIVLRRS